MSAISSSFAIERGLIRDNATEMYSTKRVLCALKHDNTLSSYAALFVSVFAKEALSSPFGRRRRLPFSSTPRLIRGSHVKYDSDEAERRVSDNAGYDGAYYRINASRVQ